MTQNHKPATVFLKAVVPGEMQLRLHHNWEYPAIKVSFSQEEQHRLRGVGIDWPSFEFAVEDTRMCLEGRGFATWDRIIHWTYKGQTMKTKVVALLQKEPDGTLEFTFAAEILKVRRPDGQKASELIQKRFPFAETFGEATAMHGAMDAYVLLQKAGQNECPWFAKTVHDLCTSLHDVLEIEMSVYEDQDDLPEGQAPKSKRTLVLRDHQEQQTMLKVVGVLCEMLPLVDLIDGIVPRSKYLKGVLDTLEGFRDELRKMKPANQLGPSKKNRDRKMVDRILTAAGMDPHAADEVDEEGALNEPPAETAPPPKPAATPGFLTKLGKSKATKPEVPQPPQAPKAARPTERVSVKDFKDISKLLPDAPTAPNEPNGQNS